MLFLNSWRVSSHRVRCQGMTLALQLFKKSNDTREKLRLNFHSLSVSELLECGRKECWSRLYATVFRHVFTCSFRLQNE
jgi:hypothetical protein